MIISQTPFRVSFFGGGTDYPAWYKEHDGSVLSTTIDKYCYLSVRKLPPFFEHRHRIVYSNIELVNHIESIRHPSVRAVLRSLNPKEGLEIIHNADLPARSGIGSSSAFTVGLLNALKTLEGVRLNKRELADEALFIEQQVLDEAVGSQDQVAVSFGGFNRIDFSRYGYNLLSVGSPFNKHELNRRLMLFYTRVSRLSNPYAEATVSSIRSGTDLSELKDHVNEACDILNNPWGNLDNFGTLMRKSWDLKRAISPKISTSHIDDIIEAGINAGALGGKMCGAGGGGFVLFYCPVERQELLRERLKSLVEVQFKFEDQGSVASQRSQVQRMAEVVPISS